MFDIKGPIQKIGGVGPSGTHSPPEIALIAFVSSKSNAFRTSPFELAMWVAVLRKYSHNLVVGSNVILGMSETRTGGKPGISRRSILLRSLML